MFESIIKTEMLEGDLIFIDRKTNKVFLLLPTSDTFGDDPAVGEEACIERLRYYGIEDDIDSCEVVYDEGNLTIRFIMA